MTISLSWTRNPAKMQGEQWIVIANFRLEMYSVDSSGRKKYRFLKNNYKQIVPAQFPSHTSVCSSYIIYAAFHLFNSVKTNLEEFKLIVFCFISNYV